MLIKILTIVLIFYTNILVHEFFHYLSIKFCGQKAIISIGSGKLLFKYKDLEIRLNPMASYVQPLENVYNKQSFYISGCIGNLFLAFLLKIFFPNYIALWMYCVMMFIGNIILISPETDLFKALSLEKYCKKLPDVLFGA